MSEETKKQPETEQEQAAAETKAPAAESDKQEAEPAAEKTEKKDWFGKKSKELEAVKAKLEAAEQANAKLKDQMLRTAAEYDNYRKRSAREAERSSTMVFPTRSTRSWQFWIRWIWQPMPNAPTKTIKRAL